MVTIFHDSIVCHHDNNCHVLLFKTIGKWALCSLLRWIYLIKRRKLLRPVIVGESNLKLWFAANTAGGRIDDKMTMTMHCTGKVKFWTKIQTIFTQVGLQRDSRDRGKLLDPQNCLFMESKLKVAKNIHFCESQFKSSTSRRRTSATWVREKSSWRGIQVKQGAFFK